MVGQRAAPRVFPQATATALGAAAWLRGRRHRGKMRVLVSRSAADSHAALRSSPTAHAVPEAKAPCEPAAEEEAEAAQALRI